MSLPVMPLSWNTDGLDTTERVPSASSLVDQYSNPVDVRRYRSYGFSFVWYHAATASTGNLYLQFSWDGTNWSNSGAAAVAISTASGNTFFNVTFPGGEPYARLYFDRTADGVTGAITGKFFGRDI